MQNLTLRFISKAMSRLNLTPKDCLIVEDNENGIQAAKRCASGSTGGEGEFLDVTYDNIKKCIQKIEKRSRAA